MSTDREQMELAAKAIGKKLRWDGPDDVVPHDDATFEWWSPLDDDGDSRRLQIELPGCAMLSVDDVSSNVSYWYKTEDGMDLARVGVFHKTHNGDRAASARMAVFLAAAEIGRAMP